MNDYSPIIILGMPRSGTKLIRTLLNQHPLINIPEKESYLFHSLLKKFGPDFDFRNKRNLLKLYIYFKGTKFYRSFSVDNIELSFNSFMNIFADKNWSYFFKVIFNYYGPKGIDHYGYWGDKSPGSYSQITWILKVFPDAKFIHLVRDPRDYCVSAKEAWGKNIYRSMYRWQSEINYFYQLKDKLKFNCISIKYEDLLYDSKYEMINLCNFLDIEYVEGMDSPVKIVENLGHAKGMSSLKRNNSKKYINKLSIKQIYKIESIGFDAILKTGYKPDFSAKQVNFNIFFLNILSYFDGFNSILFHVKDKGLLKGFKYFYILHSNKR